MFTNSIAAARIQRELPATENAIDTALVQSSGLMQTLAIARGLEDVPFKEGQTAILRLMETQSSLIKASAEIRRVHSELTKINREIKAMPDENGDCPWPEALASQSTNKIA